MTKRIASIIIILLCLAVLAQAQTTLEIIISNISSKDGHIRVALFNNEQGFLKTALKTQGVKISGNEITCAFSDIEEGEYAISAFHDINDNSILDKNWVGIPTEPYGFSNNARGTFGPPSFGHAKIVVVKGVNRKEFALK